MTVCAPAPRCDAVNGVIQVGSLQPSISTLAPAGCVANFNSLCWLKTLSGELVAFCGCFCSPLLVPPKCLMVTSLVISGSCALLGGVVVITAVRCRSSCACTSFALISACNCRILICVL